MALKPYFFQLLFTITVHLDLFVNFDSLSSFFSYEVDSKTKTCFITQSPSRNRFSKTKQSPVDKHLTPIILVTLEHDKIDLQHDSEAKEASRQFRNQQAKRGVL